MKQSTENPKLFGPFCLVKYKIKFKISVLCPVVKAGDLVSVYSDIEGKCKRGAKEFEGVKVFLGNGISELSRNDIFGLNGRTT